MDITEGKISLMIIHTLRNANQKDKEELIKILHMHTKEEKLKNKAIEILKKYGAIEYARNLASNIVAESWLEIKNILPSSQAKKKLKVLANYLIFRNI